MFARLRVWRNPLSPSSLARRPSSRRSSSCTKSFLRSAAPCPLYSPSSPSFPPPSPLALDLAPRQLHAHHTHSLAFLLLMSGPSDTNPPGLQTDTGYQTPGLNETPHPPTRSSVCADVQETPTADSAPSPNKRTTKMPSTNTSTNEARASGGSSSSSTRTAPPSAAS